MPKFLTRLTILLLTLVAFFASASTAIAQAVNPNDLKAIYQDSVFFDANSGYCTPSTNTASTTFGAGSKVYILGDSITVRASSAYTSAIQQLGGTAFVDGSSSRSINGAGIDGNKLSGMAAINQDAAQIQQANYIVVALGTNGGDTPQSMSALISAIKQHNTSAPIFWVDTTVINRPDYVGVIRDNNQAIYGQESALQYKVISWFRTVTPNGNPQNPTGTETDTNGYIVNGDEHVHPTPAGITALVNLVTQNLGTGGATTPSVNLNGCACGVSVSTNLSGNDNVEKIYNYLIGKGLTPVQAAAVMANIQAESGFNPRAVEIAFSPAPHLSDTVPDNVNTKGQPGYGLAQWTAPSRKQGLKDLASQRGLPASDLGLQLDYLWQELNTGYKNSVLIPLQQATSLPQATEIYVRNFEGPANINQAVATRTGFAQTLYSKLSGTTTVATVATASTGGCNQVSAPGQDTKYVDGFTIYSQKDATWKNNPYGTSTIFEAGCGPSAMAMIITALTGNPVTPADTTDFANTKNLYISGVGSSWTVATVLAAKWGLKAAPVGNNVASITAALQAGGLVIGAGSGAEPFTTAGHYIVIRGVTSDGKFKIAESWYGESTYSKDWDPNQIVTQMSAGSLYVVTK